MGKGSSSSDDTGSVGEPVASQLKQRTAREHALVEGVVPLLSPSLTREAYAGHLALMYGFLRPLESALAEPGGALERIGVRIDRRCALLERDLVALGWSPRAVAAVPECEVLPPTSPWPEALGVAYVLQGSTLGGRVLLRSVEQRLGVDAAQGAAFVAGHGAQTAARWRAFLSELEAAPWDDASIEASVSAARCTFTRLSTWLVQGKDALDGNSL